MIVRLGLVGLALIAALVPLPPSVVEAWYARGLYPALQPPLTALSNRVPFALLDVLIAALLLWVGVVVARAFRRPKRGGRLAAMGRAVLTLAASAAVVYLAFLLLWGMNYRRVPLKDRMDFAGERVTEPAARALAEKVVGRLNALQGGGTRTPSPDWDRTTDALAVPFSRVQRQLGATWVAAPGVPKWSLLSFYFQRAAVDGMTDPFFLEVLVNRRLLPFERPFVLAHEWAHLAGYADESEASFVGWLVCLQGPAAAEYSGHLSLLWQLLPTLPPADREAVTRRLNAGSREHLAAIVKRLASTSPVVRQASWKVYDRYLKANRVEEGVRSYGAALDLMLGARLTDTWVPALVGSPGH